MSEPVISQEGAVQEIPERFKAIYHTTTETVLPDQLIAQAEAFLSKGYRLSQMHATTLADGVEINYAYAIGSELAVQRLVAAPDSELPSISSVYPPAFLYENEIHDLFGISFSGMCVDYHGNLYRLATATPFAPVAEKEAESNA